MRSKIFKVCAVFVIVALVGDAVCIAQDSVRVREQRLFMNGYIKDLQTVIFQDIQDDWITGNLIHNRLNFRYNIASSFTAGVEIRNRFLYGDILKLVPDYNKTFEEDHGMLCLSKNIFDEKSFLLNTSIDRAWLEFSKDKFQITAGRQRINWGQTLVWNPNDIFNTYSYFDFDYEEKPGSDAIRMQYYASPTSVLEFAVKSNKQKKATYAGLYRFNKWNFDIQFLGGVMDQADYVVGTGWSGQLLKGGFRGEISYFHPIIQAADTTGIWVASVGYDYGFKNALLLQFEVIYCGNKDTLNLFSLDRMTSNSMSAKGLFLSGYSLFSSASYPITPLINASLSGIINPDHNIFFVIPTLSVSLKDNLEIAFIAQLFRYYEKSQSAQNANFVFIRLKCSF